MENDVGRGRFLGLPAGCCRSVWAWCSWVLPLSLVVLGLFSFCGFLSVGDDPKTDQTPEGTDPRTGIFRCSQEGMRTTLPSPSAPTLPGVHLRPKFDGDVLHVAVSCFHLHDNFWRLFLPTSSPTGLTKAKRLFFHQPSIIIFTRSYGVVCQFSSVSSRFSRRNPLSSKVFFLCAAFGCTTTGTCSSSSPCPTCSQPSSSLSRIADPAILITRWLRTRVGQELRDGPLFGAGFVQQRV